LIPFPSVRDVSAQIVTELFFSPTSTVSAPSNREEHTAIWTGTEMIVWGGFGDGSYFDTGSRYDPSTDTWTPTSTTGAAAIRKFHSAVWTPTSRNFHSAVWTGTEMIVWGGDTIPEIGVGETDTGGIYNPSTDTWTPTTTTGAPSARDKHTAVWTGTEMIVWGDDIGSGGADRGARYDPSTDTWTPITTTGAPSAREDHTINRHMDPNHYYRSSIS